MWIGGLVAAGLVAAGWAGVAVAAQNMAALRRKPEMKTYQVWLKGMTKFIEVKADDVNLEESENDRETCTAYWNLYRGDVTVAAFPFTNVEYIASVD